LPVEVLPFDTSFWKKENYNPWKDSEAVSIRLRALGQPQAQVLLFLEYLPQSLYSWLNTKLKEDTDTASRSLRFVEENLMSVYNFMSKQNFIHFDAHFENIMTDGEQLYLSDFGLSLSTKFDLEKAEIEFFKTHQSTYDQSTMSIHLVHAVITSQYGKENWREVFKEHVDTNFINLSEPYKSTVKKHAEVALSMDDFLRKQGISPDSISYSSKL
jgi:tRNA A-37 threonylcarbamoyl transferase component Bud32